MTKRAVKAAKPGVALKFNAFAKPRVSPITLEPAIHYPLPAGQNPGDPYYGKDWLDPLNPADHAVIISKLDPSALITDAGARVLDWARRVAKADLHPSDRVYLERSGDLLALAVATLKNPDATAEDRNAAIDMAITAVLQIGEIKGRISTAFWGRKAWPRAHTSKANEGRAPALAAAALAAAARHKLIRAFCAKRKLPFDKDGLPTTLARDLGNPPGEKERTFATLKKQYARDLAKLIGT